MGLGAWLPPGPTRAWPLRLRPQAVRAQLCLGASVSRSAPTRGSRAGAGAGAGWGPAVPGSLWRALAPPPLFLGAQPPQQGAGPVWPSGAPQEFSDMAHTAVQARRAPQRAGRTLRAGHPGWRCVWLSQGHRSTWHLQR